MDQPDDTATQPVFVPDTGDIISRTEPDPPTPEVTDPDDESYVEAAHAAVRVNPHNLLSPGQEYLDPELVAPSPLTQRVGDVMPEVMPYLPPVGTSLPAAPDVDPGHSPEGHA